MRAQWPWWLLILSVVFGSIETVYAADGPTVQIDLSPTERAYRDHAPTISMCVDPDWAPFEIINQQGQHEGIAADLIQLVAQRTGLKIVLYPTKDWDESLKASKEGRCQILSFLNQTPARDQWLIFTAPIFSDPNVIITRQEHDYIGDLHGLSQATVALPRGTMVEERIRTHYPNLQVVLTDSEANSVELVSQKKADMTVRSLIVAAYSIRKEGLFNLKISGQVPEMTNQLRVGVIANEPILLSILDKGIATLTPQERASISNHHVAIQIESTTDYSLLWKVIAGAVILLGIGFSWNRKLSSLNKELQKLSVTDRLTQLYNRIKIDEALSSELKKAEQHSAPFSLILLDVDHFKQTNDLYGHQVGDHVLVNVAALLQTQTRSSDIVGRWGGEEFMIICPRTDKDTAYALAEGIRQCLAAHTFPVIGQKTASLGVATYQHGDHSESIINRADMALYAAKKGGRNRVVADGP